MKRALVTGGTGFIGSNCVPMLLDAGYEVHAVVPVGVAFGDDRAIWHVGDLLDAEQRDALLGEIKATHLLHLAWFVAPGEFWRSPENLRWLEASLDLARGFADNGGVRSVMAGTCAEYEPSMKPLVEGASPLRPSTLYGACKLALHYASAAYFAERGVSSAWAHLFYLYGPREYPGRLVPSVISALRAGEEFRCSHPADVRDFLYVEDVAGGLVQLLQSEVEGDVNVASGEPTTVGGLVTEIASLLGRNDLVQCADTEASGSVIVADNSRLAKEVGWKPRSAAREALEATVAWWKLEVGAGELHEDASGSRDHASR